MGNNCSTLADGNKRDDPTQSVQPPRQSEANPKASTMETNHRDGRVTSQVFIGLPTPAMKDGMFEVYKAPNAEPAKQESIPCGLCQGARQGHDHIREQEQGADPALQGPRADGMRGCFELGVRLDYHHQPTAQCTLTWTPPPGQPLL